MYGSCFLYIPWYDWHYNHSILHSFYSEVQGILSWELTLPNARYPGRGIFADVYATNYLGANPCTLQGTRQDYNIPLRGRK